MADITITEDQADTMLAICKDVQERVKAQGMPELDEPLAEMIEILERAMESGGEEIPGDARKKPTKKK